MGYQVLVKPQHQGAELLGPFAVGFGESARQQVQVQGHHLSEEMPGLLGGNARVKIVTAHHRQQPYFADRLDNGGNRTGFSQ